MPNNTPLLKWGLRDHVHISLQYLFFNIVKLNIKTINLQNALRDMHT